MPDAALACPTLVPCPCGLRLIPIAFSDLPRLGFILTCSLPFFLLSPTPVAALPYISPPSFPARFTSVGCSSSPVAAAPLWVLPLILLRHLGHPPPSASHPAPDIVLRLPQLRFAPRPLPLQLGPSRLGSFCAPFICDPLLPTLVPFLLASASFRLSSSALSSFRPCLSDPSHYAPSTLRLRRWRRPSLLPRFVTSFLASFVLFVRRRAC